MAVIKDLGAVTAYAAAVNRGYTGTKEEFETLMASYATVAEEAAESAESASQSATQAGASAQTATTKAGEASTSATQAGASATSASQSAETATAKASEASASASTAGTKASEASASATTASSKASEASASATSAQTAQGLAESARDDAIDAKTDAESARDLAQQYAESIDPEKIYSAYPADTASGSVASFADGADDIPMKSVKVAIEPVQDLHGQDAPYPAGGRINLLKATQYGGTYAGAIGYDLKQNDPMEYVITPDGRFEINVINAWRYRMFATDVLSAGTYTARTYGNSSAIRASIYITDSNLVVKSVIYNQSSAGWGPVQTATLDDGDRIAICIGANAVGKYITEFQVNSGDTIEAIVPFENICPISGWTGAQVSHSGADRTNPTTYSITFPSEAGTVYGGELDVTNGTLTVDRAFIASYNGETLPSEWISDRDKYVAGTTPTTGAQVVYKLATPITYHLTPTEIKSLLGDNNVWADAGDVSAEYRADTKLYIDKKLGKDAPMIATDNIVSGSYFMVGSNLYKATANIANGAAVVVGTNATAITMAEALNEINA